MRQRVIVGTKLAETLTRGVFVLVCTYRLPLVEAGQFGLAATLVGIVAFALGYERQVDLLRQVAGRPTAEVRARLSHTLRFFALHAAWVLPLAAALLAAGFGWPARLVGLAMLIALAEHLSNQSYQAVLIDRSHYPLLALVAAKNALLAGGVIALALWAPQRLTLDGVMGAWALAGALYLLLAAALWALRFGPSAAGPGQGITDQYRASRVHFVLGLVAVAALQIDRLVVGGALGAADVGVYFRNVTLAGLALQLFNIVSFNRVAPGVYAHARADESARARHVVHTEYRRFALALVAAGAIGLTAGALWPGRPLARLHIEPLFLALLGAGVLLRAAADYAGLLLLAFGADSHLLRNQAIAVIAGALALAFAAWHFGLPGAVTAALVAPAIYLLLNGADARRLARP